MIGAAPPPPRIKPTFIDPESRAQADLIIHIVCVTLINLFMLMRLYTRLIISRWISLDDCKYTFGRTFHRRSLSIDVCILVWVNYHNSLLSATACSQ